MPHETNISVVGTALHFLPVQTRVPLKFGAETLTRVTCARARVTVADAAGRTADGWGETPLSLQWVWPSGLPYQKRQQVLMEFSLSLAEAWADFAAGRIARGGAFGGHPLELGYEFLATQLPALREEMNRCRNDLEAMPYLAALVCCSPFDLALHDAFGKLHGVPTYETYDRAWMNADLGEMLEPAAGSDVSFTGRYPADFLTIPRPDRLPAWHLVGGLDLLDDAERTGEEPEDGYPVVLSDWIRQDGVKCLKVKLRGNDAEWDYDRLVRVGTLAAEHGAEWLSTDFNCTVTDPAYVNAILDRLMAEHPRIFGMVLYVEQPFPYELDSHRIDVHSVSARKPLFMDESAHDWRLVRMGRELGWTGVALKTCKTQTGALLSLCWAKAHGMTLMVQDLTNPMIAQVPHVLLAAHAGTIMGVETNAMQFYPEASAPEARVHPGLYQRREGSLDLSTVRGPGFGYRLDEIDRRLPEPAATFGQGGER